jgi:myo-inositol 2-dehydrogenase/D-chiro-inositol 1-dehydrogenase
MGADHVRRLTEKVPGAVVSAVIDADPARAAAAARHAPASAVFSSLGDALDVIRPDAVLIATPGHAHEEILHEALRLELPVLCEKPLTDEAVSARRVIEAEAAVGRRLIQVGFMRRFDPEYQYLRGVVESGRFGAPLLLHAIHRAPDVSALPNFTEQMLVTDSVVHEVDILRFLTGEEITAVTVVKPRPAGGSALSSPQLVLLETAGGTVADVEINVTAGYGYEVAGELVLESAAFEHGRELGLVRRHAGVAGREVPADFRDRFAVAYERELSAWADSVRTGRPAGPSAWDGYSAQVVCEAAVQAQRQPGTRVPVAAGARPALYGG